MNNDDITLRPSSNSAANDRLDCMSANHDQVVKKHEIAAKIIRFDENRIVLLKLGSEDEFGLPTDERYLMKGKKGIYQ